MMVRDDTNISRTALAPSCHPLLDHAATKISVDLASLGSCNRLQQGLIRNTLLACKTLEPRVLENPHSCFS